MIRVNEIICGDALAVLKTLPAESVNCCITSPPYWGLRDYGTAKWIGGDQNCGHKQGRAGVARADGIVSSESPRNRDGVGAMGGDCRRCGARREDDQIGLEKTPPAYVEKLVEIFREVRRVLRDDGTLWLVLGDSYAGSGKGLYADGDSHGTEGPKQKTNVGSIGVKIGTREGDPGHTHGVKLPSGLKPKDLVGIPWMVAFALRAEGWYLRSDIILGKPNPMPESCTDRPTRAHEYIFLLSKSARYYYDSDAIREGLAESSVARLAQNLDAQQGSSRANGGTKTNGPMKAVSRKGADKQRGHSRRHDGFNDRWDLMGKEGQGAFGRNKRSVWSIAPANFDEAHFATFPEKLVEPCILAGSPEGGLVLDPFMGSGTVALVALKACRRFLGIELSPKYVEMANRRLAPELNQLRLV